MKEKNKKRLEFQQNVITRQLEQIDLLKSQIEQLKIEIEEKNKIIDSVAPLRNELKTNISDIEKYKEEYKKLIEDVRKMKEVVNHEVYKGRWKLIKLLIK